MDGGGHQKVSPDKRLADMFLLRKTLSNSYHHGGIGCNLCHHTLKNCKALVEICQEKYQ